MTLPSLALALAYGASATVGWESSAGLRNVALTIEGIDMTLAEVGLDDRRLRGDLAEKLRLSCGLEVVAARRDERGRALPLLRLTLQRAATGDHYFPSAIQIGLGLHQDATLRRTDAPFPLAKTWWMAAVYLSPSAGLTKISKAHGMDEDPARELQGSINGLFSRFIGDYFQTNPPKPPEKTGR